MSNYHNHRKNTVANDSEYRQERDAASCLVRTMSFTVCVTCSTSGKKGLDKGALCEAILGISLQEIQIPLLNRQLLFYISISLCFPV